MLLYQISGLVELLFVNAIGCSAMLLGTSSLVNAFHPLLAEDLVWDQHLTCLFLGNVALSHCKMPQVHLSWWLTLSFNAATGTCYCTSIYYSLMLVFIEVCIPLLLMMRISLSSSICPNDCYSFSIIGGISVSRHNFQGSGCTFYLHIILPKRTMHS